MRKKKCTKILFRSKNLNVSEYIGEKKRWFYAFVNPMCAFAFSNIFFLVFLFHKLSGTYPSILGIACVFRFWKVLIFFQFNQIFSNTLQEKAAAENKHISFSKPIFSPSFLFWIQMNLYSKYILAASYYKQTNTTTVLHASFFVSAKIDKPIINKWMFKTKKKNEMLFNLKPKWMNKP